MPVVYYNIPNIARLLTVRGKPGVEFTFVPGAENEVPQDVWDDLCQNSETVQDGLDERWLKVVTQPAQAPANGEADTTGKKSKGNRLRKVGEKSSPPDSAGGAPSSGSSDGGVQPVNSLDDLDISIMTRFDAQDVVRGVVNEERLDKFEKQERARRDGGRKGVLRTLESQKATVTAADQNNTEAAERTRKE